MAGGRVRVNTAVFYNDYQDLQVQSFLRPGVIDISNAGSATIKGIEVEAAAAAGRGIHLEAMSPGSTRSTTVTSHECRAA